MYSTRRKVSTIFLLSLFLLSLKVIPSFSEEEQKTHNIKETVVVASDDTKIEIVPGGYEGKNTRLGILSNKSTLDVPFSTTSYTRKTIDIYGESCQPINGVLSNNPSIQNSGVTMYNDFSVRGLRLNGYQLYLNGVPGMYTQSNTALNFADAVELTEGPGLGLNGTTLRQSAGGTVNIVSKKATNEPLNRYFQGFSGKSSFTEAVDFSRRFGENKKWGVRINAKTTDGETALPGEKLMSRNIYVNLDRTTEKATTNLLAGYTHVKHEGGIRWFKYGSGVTKMLDAPNSKTNFSFPGAVIEYKSWIAVINHEQKITDKLKWFINAGYNDYEIVNNLNAQSSVYTIKDNAGNFDAVNWNRPLWQKIYTTQIGLQYKFETGVINHDVVLALDKAWLDYATNKTGNWQFNSAPGNIYTGVPDIAPVIKDAGVTRGSKQEYSGWEIVDTMTAGKWIFIAGAHGHKASTKSYKLDGETVTSQLKTDDVCPTFGIVYKPVQNVALYANYTESFAAGSAVSSKYVNNGEILPPAKTKQKEVGVKWDNKQMLLKAAFFDTKQSNNIDVEKSTGTYLLQDGEVEYKGAELSVAGKLTEKWSGFAGFMYLDATRNNTSKGTLDGYRANGIPHVNGVVGVEYAANEKFSLLGRGVYRGDCTINDGKFEVPSSTVFDFGARYKTKFYKTPVTITAMIYNITGKDYWLPMANSNTMVVSNPRTFVLSAYFDF